MRVLGSGTRDTHPAGRLDNPLEVLNAGFHGPRTEPLQILRLNTLPVFRPRRGAVAPSRPAEEGRLNIAPAATDIRSRVEAATRIASDPITVRVPVAYRVPAHHIPSCTSSADSDLVHEIRTPLAAWTTHWRSSTPDSTAPAPSRCRSCA